MSVTTACRDAFRTLIAGGALMTLLLWPGSTHATPFLSDGSDGAFAPLASTTIDLSTAGDNGVFNFTTIDIPANVTVRFALRPDNPAVVFGATGNVNIAGTILLSAFNQTGGPGGGEGGNGGNGDNVAATAGTGIAPGLGGLVGLGFTRGGGGGGGGNATPGGIAVARTGPGIGAAGAAVPPPLVINGGSGGGGGGGGVFFGVDTDGGSGGAGGGGLQVSTPGTLNLTGTLLADGAHGGFGFVISASGGGGGSGGNFELNAATINVGASARISALGGAGGGLSSESCAVLDPYRCSTFANGGLGYVIFDGATTLQAGADVFARPVGAVVPGLSPDNPLLPIPPSGPGPWAFGPVDVRPTGFGGFHGPSFWFDPLVAIGYDYAVTGARIATVELPSGFGDDSYEIWLINPATGLFELVQTLGTGVQLDLTALDPFGTGPLSGGVAALRVLGIEVSESLDPDDTAAFPTGLTFLPSPGGSFNDIVTASLTMTPIVKQVDGPVPQPATLVLMLASGILALRGRARRRWRRGR